MGREEEHVLCRLSPQLTPQVAGDVEVRELVKRVAVSHEDLQGRVGALTALALSNAEASRRIEDLLRSVLPL